MGGSGYLYVHNWPPVDREPAINVDMMNEKTMLNYFQTFKSYNSKTYQLQRKQINLSSNFKLLVWNSIFWLPMQTYKKHFTLTKHNLGN